MLRIRYLQLTVNTDKGVFGAKRAFGDGLNVIRAENWAGKSLVLQSIIYALGLEGMFGPSQDVPLPHAVTHYLDFKGGRANVIDSMASLEIENEKGEFLTVQRAVAGERNRHLVTVYEGRAVTQNSVRAHADYFVRERGGATSERGFHRRLTSFLGWSLPMAPRHDEEDCPLYLETIFPLVYVEQKLGWGRIPAKYPTYLGIRDVGRRTVEFVLGLDAYAIAIERAAVQGEIARIRSEWITLRAHAGKMAATGAGLLTGIPTDPISSWPPEVPAQIMMPRNREWVPLPSYLASLRERLAELNNQPVPSSGAVDERVRQELSNAETQLAERERLTTALVEKIDADNSEAVALKGRIESIEDDLRKYKDVRRLRALGSTDQPDSITKLCPTCHQELVDSLLDLGKRASPMSIDQNVTFYQEQLQLFAAVLANARRSIEANEVQLQHHRAESEKLRERIRALRATLVSASESPSIEAITERLRLQNRVEQLELLLANFEDVLSEFAQLASDWRTAQERRGRLPKGALSSRDEHKLNAVEASFKEQLRLYKMGSVSPEELNISRGNYEPEKSGINLGADVSGSDLIRLQWSYLLALLEVGLSNSSSNHPALLIMDEPQQQSVEESAFRAMLEYSAGFKKAQVIVATSHERSTIGQFLQGIGITNVYEYEDARLIDRI